MNLPVAAVAWLVGRRVLPLSAPKADRGTPDYPGVVLVSTALAALVLAISEGPSWGWSSGRVIACFAGAGVLGCRLLVPLGPSPRARARPEPVLGPLVQRRQHGDAALFDGLLRHAARQHLVPHRRLALLDPESGSGDHAGPARGGGRVRAGRPAGRPGRVPHGAARRRLRCSPAGCAGTRPGSGLRPDYLGRWLPATLVVGLGIGLTFPVLSAAAVSSLQHGSVSPSGAP